MRFYGKLTFGICLPKIMRILCYFNNTLNLLHEYKCLVQCIFKNKTKITFKLKLKLYYFLTYF